MTQEFDAELVEKVAESLLDTGAIRVVSYNRIALAEAALSVIAPHYEKQIAELKHSLEVKDTHIEMHSHTVGKLCKQIAELKAQIPQWNDDMDAAPLKTLIDIVGFFKPHGVNSRRLIRLCDREFFNKDSRKPHFIWLNENTCGHFQPTHWMLSPRLPESPLNPPKTAESESQDANK